MTRLLQENDAQPEELAVSAGPVSRHAMEIWISHVLRSGVLVAGLLILAGGAMFLLAGPGRSDPHSLRQLLNGDYANRSSLSAIIDGITRARGSAVVDLGLLALILTPVIRVAMTVALFFLQKDWVFVAITLTVLVVLLFGVSGLGV